MNNKEDLKFMLKASFIGIVSLITILLIIGTVTKPFTSGTSVTEGLVVSHFNGIFYCVEISKSKIGESNVKQFCSYRGIMGNKEKIKLNAKIKIRYTVSPLLFMDTIEIL